MICEKYSKKISKPGSKLHALRRISHFRWLGQTVLRIPSFHGVYVNFKLKFSALSLVNFHVYIILSFILLYGMSRLLFLLSFCQLQVNIMVAKATKFYLINLCVRSNPWPTLHTPWLGDSDHVSRQVLEVPEAYVHVSHINGF